MANLKRLEIPLCDITLCSGPDCDVPPFHYFRKQVFNPAYEKKESNTNNSFDMKKTDLLKEENENSCSSESIDIEKENELESKENHMSEYEKMVKRNREEKRALLLSLKINEAKESFMEAVNKCKPKRAPRVLKRPRLSESVPVRKSRRLAKLDIDLSEDALFAKAVAAVTEAAEEKKVKILPKLYSFNEAVENQEDYLNFINDFDFHSKENKQIYDNYISRLKQMKLKESNIAKVVPTRITCLAIHPTTDNIIVVAGSKYGHMGFWNVTSESNPLVFAPHTDGVTNLKFNPKDSLKIASSSYDGTLRIGDLEKKIFDQVYNESEETSCTYFDFLSSNTFLVSMYNGCVSVVDVRGRQNGEKRHQCHERNIKTISIHPVNKNLFLSADSKGIMKLWDLRKLQKKPLIQIQHHWRSVSSAFFSPANGNFILATSLDNSLSIFDSSNVEKEILFKKSIRHNNHTGRWLSPFKARWLPNSEDAFIVGSMQYPRRIEVFSSGGNRIHDFMDDNLTSITSTNEFHPSLTVLVGGNSSGKVFVFTDTELKF